MRLARRLSALAADYGSEVHISQEQLGVFVGAARESVNRQLQLWRKDGMLDLQRGRIVLVNLDRLAAVAGYVHADDGPEASSPLSITARRSAR